MEILGYVYRIASLPVATKLHLTPPATIISLNKWILRSPADMDAMNQTLKDSSKMKEDGEDLEFVISNAKRSAANRAIAAHKLNT